MNSQQLQTAIDKCLTTMVENGCNLKQYHPHFYEKFSTATLNLLQVQVVRAELVTKPIVQIKEKNT
jgi:hypothetical protein